MSKSIYEKLDAAASSIYDNFTAAFSRIKPVEGTILAAVAVAAFGGVFHAAGLGMNIAAISSTGSAYGPEAMKALQHVLTSTTVLGRMSNIVSGTEQANSLNLMAVGDFIAIAAPAIVVAGGMIQTFIDTAADKAKHLISNEERPSGATRVSALDGAIEACKKAADQQSVADMQSSTSRSPSMR